MNAKQARYVAALSISAAALAPFLVAFCFVHPSYDDPGYYLEAKSRGLLSAQAFWYRTFSGRYVSNAIVSVLSYSIHHVWVYRLICLAIFGALLVSVYRLLRAALSCDRIEAAALAGLAITTFLVMSPGIAEGFYWLTGSATYTLGVAFMFLAVAGLLATDAPKVSTWSTAAWIVLAVGMNEVVLLLLNGFLALLIARAILDTRKVERRYLWWMAISGLASLASVAAPGNRNRLEFSRDVTAASGSLPNAIIGAARDLLSDSYYLVHVSPVLFLLLATLVLDSGIGRPARVPGWKRELAAVPCVLAVVYCVLAFFIYAQGVRPIPRVMNVIYLSLIVFAVVMTARVGRLGLRENRYSALVLTIVLLGFADVTVRLGSGVRIAYAELRSGAWRRYDLQVKERGESLSLQAGRNAIVPPLTDRPSTIFVFDISTDPAQRHNVLYAGFYGVRSLSVTPTNP